MQDWTAGLKHAQMNYFDSVGASELEITRPHGCGRVYNFLLETKVNTVLGLYGKPLSNKRVVDVCCGSGMDAEFLHNAGARIVGVDISLGALRGAQERARRYQLQYDLVVADAAALPFRDKAFDISFVHDGLHHLGNPHTGCQEMARVAGQAVLITEPAKAFGTAVGVRLGMAEAVEESGNRVHRFSRRELRDLLVKAGFNHFRSTRYLMYYRQEPLKIFRWFEGALAFGLFETAYRLAHLLLGRWGNKLAAVAWRSKPTQGN